MSSRLMGRYELLQPLATGGMGEVCIGRAHGESGFSRLVAVKTIRGDLLEDAKTTAAFRDEARLVARIRHPNVVATLDLVSDGGRLVAVMDYVHGESLATLAGRRPVAPAIAAAVVGQALRGLHAAHEATTESGKPLDIVHRDVSPQNILVGEDGLARVADFGIAKAMFREQHTADGAIKGKVRYMAPEQLHGDGVDRRTDVWAAGAVLWELLVGRQLFEGDQPAAVVTQVLFGEISRPGRLVDGIPPSLDAVVMCALDRKVDRRFPTAKAMADALEDAVAPATTRRIAAWVEEVAGERLRSRAKQLADLGSTSMRVVSTPTEVPPRVSPAGEANAPRESTALVAARDLPTEPRAASTTRGRSLAVALTLVVLASVGGGAALTLRYLGPSETERGQAGLTPAAQLTQPTALSPESPPTASATPSSAAHPPPTTSARTTSQTPAKAATKPKTPPLASSSLPAHDDDAYKNRQ